MLWEVGAVAPRAWINISLQVKEERSLRYFFQEDIQIEKGIAFSLQKESVLY